MNKIIAIVGMSGSGKSVAVQFLENLEYQKIYFGGITYEKMKEQNIEITPETETIFRENLRKEYGMGAYAILSLSKIKEGIKNNNVVIDGLYSWDELKILASEFPGNFYTIAIITDKNIRYQRVGKRKGRSYSLEDIKKRDISEIENLDKGGPICFADYFVFNNGSVAELEARLTEIISSL